MLIAASAGARRLSNLRTRDSGPGTRVKQMVRKERKKRKGNRRRSHGLLSVPPLYGLTYTSVRVGRIKRQRRGSDIAMMPRDETEKRG